MKKYITAFLLILISSSVFAQKPHSAKDLLGKWEGKDSKNEVGGLYFLKDSKMVLLARGTYSPAINYTIDFKSNPIKIDMAMQSLDGTSRMNVKGLLLFIDNNTLKLQLFPGGIRSDNFDPLFTQNILILKRSKS